MKRRILFVLSALLVLGGLLAGCSSGKGSSNGGGGNKKVTLNAIFMKQAGYSESDIKSMTKNFEKQNPNIHVNLNFVAYEALEQKIESAAQAGSYDVALIDQPWTAKFAAGGLVKNLSGKLSSQDKKDIFKPVLQAMTYKNKLYAMPWLNDTKYLFYNKEMLKKAGFNHPPRTWSELQHQAQVIKQKGIVKYPIVWSWKQAEALTCDVTSVFYSYGGHFVNKNSKPDMTNSANLKALQFMRNTIKSGITNPNSTQYLENDVGNVFSSGKAAFALNWTYLYNQANDKSKSKVAGKVGIALSPGTQSVKSASVNGGMGLAITAGSKHPTQAWKYIKYMSSKKVQENHAKNALPIWKSLYDNKKVIQTNPAVVKVAKQQYQYLVSRPKVPWYGQFSQDIQVQTQKVLSGNESPKQGLANIQKQAKQISNGQ